MIEGEVRQAMPFGEHLVLRRRLEADLGGRTLRIRDRVRNDGRTPSPLAVLYHLNVGWPVVSPRARVTATVIGEMKGEKTFSYRYKPKERQRKRRGHRQIYTRMKIETIEG